VTTNERKPFSISGAIDKEILVVDAASAPPTVDTAYCVVGKGCSSNPLTLRYWTPASWSYRPMLSCPQKYATTLPDCSNADPEQPAATCRRRWA